MSGSEQVKWSVESYFPMDLYNVDDLITALETVMWLLPTPLSVTIGFWDTEMDLITHPVLKALARWTELIEGRQEEAPFVLFVLSCNFKLPNVCEQRDEMILSMLKLSNQNCIWEFISARKFAVFAP